MKQAIRNLWRILVAFAIAFVLILAGIVFTWIWIATDAPAHGR